MTGYLRAVSRLLRCLLSARRRQVRQLISRRFLKACFEQVDVFWPARRRRRTAFRLGEKDRRPGARCTSTISTRSSVQISPACPGISIALAAWSTRLPARSATCRAAFRRKKRCSTSAHQSTRKQTDWHLPGAGRHCNDAAHGTSSSAWRFMRSSRRAARSFRAPATAYGAEPNTQACLVDLGYPGRAAGAEQAEVMRYGLRSSVKAIGATVAPRSVFARKNYFYPDLPKGYQISQYELPIVARRASIVHHTGRDGDDEAHRHHARPSRGRCRQVAA